MKRVLSEMNPERARLFDLGSDIGLLTDTEGALK